MTLRAKVQPKANLHLFQKWDMIEHETHRYNVRHAKSRVDLEPPMTFKHLFLKPKKLQLELERASDIDRDNRFLADRLAEINRKGSWTDNKNYHQLRSKNTTSRQKDMMNLTYSNKNMLEMIKDVHPNYTKNRFKDEYLLQQKHRAIVLKYPRNWREIRDKKEKERALIRRLYVYPRFGVKIKTVQKHKGTGDGKCKDSENYGKNEKLSKFGEKLEIQKSARKNEPFVSAEGESQFSKKRGTGENGMIRDASKEETQQIIETSVAMGSPEQTSDCEMNIKTSSEEMRMVQQSAVIQKVGEGKGKNTILGENEFSGDRDSEVPEEKKGKNSLSDENEVLRNEESEMGSEEEKEISSISDGNEFLGNDDRKMGSEDSEMGLEEEKENSSISDENKISEISSEEDVEKSSTSTKNEDSEMSSEEDTEKSSISDENEVFGNEDSEMGSEDQKEKTSISDENEDSEMGSEEIEKSSISDESEVLGNEDSEIGSEEEKEKCSISDQNKVQRNDREMGSEYSEMSSGEQKEKSSISDESEDSEMGSEEEKEKSSKSDENEVPGNEDSERGSEED